MKLSISGIIKNSTSHYLKDDIILDIFLNKDNFTEYEFLHRKSTESKLVFKNNGHKKEFHNINKNDYYTNLLGYIVACTLLIINGYYLTIIFVTILLVAIAYKVFSDNETPYYLVLEGHLIYELNYVRKKVNEFHVYHIEESDHKEYDTSFIFLSSKEGKEMKSLMIMEDSSYDIKSKIYKFYRKFHFSNK